MHHCRPSVVTARRADEVVPGSRKLTATMTSPTHVLEPIGILEGMYIYQLPRRNNISIGHDERVWDVAWNPVEPLLASCSQDKTIRIAAYATGGPQQQFANVAQIPTGHKRTVRALAWAPSGRTLAAASFDSTISIWEREDGDGDWECAATLEGHETEVKGVAYNHEGTMLATCGRDKSVWIWEGARVSRTAPDLTLASAPGLGL